MEIDEPNSTSISLFDPSILDWDRPLPEGMINFLDVMGGMTLPKKYLGLDSLNLEIGDYVVQASVAKYLVDLSLNHPNYVGRRRSNPQIEKILFLGGIHIYQKGIIPGTTFEGYDLVRNGKIRVAFPPYPNLKSSSGLKLIVCGENFSIPEQTKRIEQIIIDYEEQDETRRKLDLGIYI